MGKMIYGSGCREIEIEDRSLAHLKIVIITKFRRNESFTFSWPHGIENGSGRSTIWLHPAVPIEFIFYGNRSPDGNREWVEQLMHSANSAEGLRLLAEPGTSNTP